ncbi:Taurine import ATP-binding protein TauB [compost metagenome]
MLNLIAGFIEPTAGSITLDEVPVKGPGAERGVVFQHEGLLPWRNVVDNVEFGLQLAGVAKPQRRKVAQQMLQRVGLTGYEQHFIWQLSGGMRLLITHDIEEAVFLASELLLLSPGPGQVVERLSLNFGQRYAAGEACRSIKSDPEFIAQREYVLGRVFQQREALL